MTEPVADDTKALLRQRVAGEIACAECRRSRIRCDRKIPCAACTRRGCAGICPTGILSGPVERVVLATPIQLREKLQTMKARIRDLEAALREAQSCTSGDVHPLLFQSDQQGAGTYNPDNIGPSFGSVDDINNVPTKLPSTKSKATPLVEATSADALARAFGTISITPERGLKWYGKTATSEHLLENDEKQEGIGTMSESGLPPEILFLSICFPYVTFHGLFDSVDDQLEHWLPPRTTAWRLVEDYFAHMDALFSIFPRDRFIKQTWQPLYESFEPITLDQLTRMFIILACGALLDSTGTTLEADKFYKLARCAMALKPSIHPPTITDVQIQFLSTYYVQLSGRGEEAWNSIGPTVKMAQYLGLRVATRSESNQSSNNLIIDIDPLPVKKPSTEDVEFRRRVFWEVYSLDSWLALGFGRPPIIVNTYTDCQLPWYPEEIDEEGMPCQSYQRFKHEFSRKYLVTLTQDILYADYTGTDAYKSILALDKSLRDNSMVPHLRVGASPSSGFGQSEQGLMLQRYILSLVRQYVLLLIHRPYSCRAASEMPSNPLKHAFGPSVLATYKCATAIADIMADLLDHNPAWTRLLVPLYSIAFCAATTLGSLVIFAPRWTHAAKVLMHVDKICGFFETTGVAQMRKLLPPLLNLREKARQAYSRPNVEPGDQDLGRELALRLSGDKPLLRSSKTATVCLADSLAFREAHPSIISCLEEFSQPSGVVTPAGAKAWHTGLAEGIHSSLDPFVEMPLSSVNGESWQLYLASLGQST